MLGFLVSRVAEKLNDDALRQLAGEIWMLIFDSASEHHAD